MKQQCILNTRRKEPDTSVLIIIKMVEEICMFLNCGLKNIGHPDPKTAVGYIQSSVS